MTSRSGRFRKRIFWGREAIFAIALLGTFCVSGQGPVTPAPPQPAPPAETWLSFEGNLSATGTRQALAMGPGREAKIVYFSGSLIMTTQEGLSRGFRIEMVGYDAGAGLSVGTLVWTDDRGDKLFSELKGESIGTARHVTGTITGGTGRYAGLEGEYGFIWKYVIQESDGTIQGRAVGLKGRYHRVARALGKGSP